MAFGKEPQRAPKFLYINTVYHSRLADLQLAKYEFPYCHIAATEDYIAALTTIITAQGPFDHIIAEFHFGRTAGRGKSGSEFLVDLRNRGIPSRVTFFSPYLSRDVFAAIESVERHYAKDFLAFNQQDIVQTRGNEDSALSEIIYRVIGDSSPTPLSATGASWWSPLLKNGRSPS